MHIGLKELAYTHESTPVNVSVCMCNREMAACVNNNVVIHCGALRRPSFI